MSVNIPKPNNKDDEMIEPFIEERKLIALNIPALTIILMD